MSFYAIPESVIKDDFEFLSNAWRDYKEGRIDSEAFKVIRVPYGIYEQRERNTYMVRIKTHAASISPSQLLGLSELSFRYANHSLHITTRGGIQLHYVGFDDLLEVTRELHKLGLSGRGGGGNTVRNIACDAYSGVAVDDVFDVAPYANELTTRMLGLKDSFGLPRKFKIAFSSSRADRAMATITDVGYIATLQEGKRGFIVYVGGGMGSKSRLGTKILDFLPEEEVFLYTQGIKQVFNKYGNRENKHSARLRFLVEKIGIEKFLELLEVEIGEIKVQGEEWKIKVSKVEESYEEVLDEEICFANKEQEIWWNRFVKPQKQKGYYSIKIPLELGDIPYKSAENLAKVLQRHSLHKIHCLNNQNLLLTNLKAKDALEVYPIILEFSKQSREATIFGDMVACTGAATCQLGIARPRGAIAVIEEFLLQKEINLDVLQDFRIHLSGCPNSCGNHLSANLGFFGRIMRCGGVPYPAYNVVVGGVIGEGETRLAKKIAAVAAFYLPQFVYEVLGEFIAKKEEFVSFENWVDNGGEEKIIELASKYEKVPTFEEEPRAYYDWSSEELFRDSLKKNGIGEEN